MIREAFKVVKDPVGIPMVMKVEITDNEGRSWRQAKKELRQWYLEQARQLRSITQKGYFTDGAGGA